ncbi:MAG: hypothetical protein AAB892_00820 [Patescibacteria group bacterium]
MQTNLTNLLPRDRKHGLVRDYIFRIVVVAICLLAALIVVHGALLLPSYIYVVQQASSRAEQLATLQIAASATSEQELKGRVDALKTKATQLKVLGTQATAAGAIKAVLAVPRTGINIHGFTFTPSVTLGANRMTLVGVAVNRDALRQYVQILGTLPFVAKAELPISSYAKERDIAFTVTLTGTLLP